MKIAPNLVFIATLLLAIPSASTLKAADFDWMVSLNLRSHSDPYAYRYGLMDRFHYNEVEVISIMDNVYEPADAYMIFRLAELSNRPPEYVLHIYRERRFSHWDDFALFLGIPVYTPMFTSLRHGHDIVYRERPHVRYEEYHHNEPRRYVPPTRIYVEQPPHREYVEPPRRDQGHVDQSKKELHDPKHDRDKKDDDRYDRR